MFVLQTYYTRVVLQVGPFVIIMHLLLRRLFLWVFMETLFNVTILNCDEW